MSLRPTNNRQGAAVMDELKDCGVIQPGRGSHQLREIAMGFRSTFATQDYGIHWPQWFRDKYAGAIWFSESGSGPLNSVREAKTYMLWQDLHTDIQRAINWDEAPTNFVLVYLHECGGITRCQIEKDAIKWSEPEGWRSTDGVKHNYCYGCSDSPTPLYDAH